MEVSLIIVTYNSSDTIADCIGSILKNKGRYEIIVVDNASSDNTVEILEKNFASKIKLLKNNKNIGFTKACNQGGKVARGEYLLFLNPDTEILTENFFNKLLKFIKNKKRLGIVGFKFLNPDRSFQQSCGYFPTLQRIILDRIKFLNVNYGIQIRNKDFYKKTQKVDWVSASGLLVKRQIFEKLGGFNENIFMYGEDYDLCYRLNLKGFQNFLFPEVRIMHYDSGKNISHKKPFKYFAMRRGFNAFLKKYRARESAGLYQVLVKLEAFLFLLLLPLRNYDSEIKTIWKTYLLKSLTKI